MPFKTKNKNYILLNKFGSNVSMKFVQLMSYHKRKKIIKKYHKNCNLKTSSMPFCNHKESSTISIGKWNF